VRGFLEFFAQGFCATLRFFDYQFIAFQRWNFQSSAPIFFVTVIISCFAIAKSRKCTRLWMRNGVKPGAGWGQANLFDLFGRRLFLQPAQYAQINFIASSRQPPSG